MTGLQRWRNTCSCFIPAPAVRYKCSGGSLQMLELRFPSTRPVLLLWGASHHCLLGQARWIPACPLSLTLSLCSASSGLSSFPTPSKRQLGKASLSARHTKVTPDLHLCVLRGSEDSYTSRNARGHRPALLGHGLQGGFTALFSSGHSLQCLATKELNRKPSDVWAKVGW